MKKFKNLISLVLTLLILLMPINSFAMNPIISIDRIPDVEEIQTEELKRPKFNTWAALTIDEAMRSGIIPFEYIASNKNFTLPMTQEELIELETAIIEKIESNGLNKNNNFSPIKILDDLTRESIVLRVYNILGSYTELGEIGQPPIEVLKELNILQGYLNDFRLKDIATVEETILFYQRALNYIYSVNDLGAKGVFYKVTHGENTAYLFGSIHIGDYCMYPIDQDVIRAYKSSDALFVELDLLNQEIHKKAKSELLRSDNITLAEELGPETYEKLQKFLTKLELPTDYFDKFEIWTVYSSLSKIPQQLEMPYATSMGVDLYFIQDAKLNGKEVIPLETLEIQYNTLKNFSKENYAQSIDYLLTEFLKGNTDLGINSTKALISAWTNGDTDFFDKIYNSGDPYTRLLLDERDPKMAKKIADLLYSEGNNTYFIVVGSAHYAPKGSVVDILKNQGFTVENLTHKDL